MTPENVGKAALALSEAYATGGRDAMAAMIERVSMGAIAGWVASGEQADDPEIMLALAVTMAKIGEQAGLLIQAQLNTRQ